jgi:hypothetical protein
VILAGLEPAWTLTGGGALVGFHTKHRETRDLDLFFHHRSTLGLAVPDATRLLVDAGYSVMPLRSSATFAQFEVRSGQESIVVDLVADPTPIAEPSVPMTVDMATILVETPHQLLVNKLCALLSRSELRDLVDVRALLDAGGDLTRALADCPRQDGGFSPLTFSWAVKSIAIEKLARALGWDDGKIDSIVRFRDELVDRVVDAAQP